MKRWKPSSSDMARRISYRNGALRNIEAIHRLISRDRPRAADGIVERIRGRINDLLQFPEQGRESPRRGHRELPIAGTPYIVTYRVGRDDIQIVRVRHGARRPLD